MTYHEPLAQELQDALDDPARGEWGGYPWEHLGDAERDVRKLLAALRDLTARLERAERIEQEAQAVIDDYEADAPGIWPPHPNWTDPHSRLWHALALPVETQEGQ